MPRKRVGLKEVAALAGTSIATVSRVLNNTGYASAEIRQRVLEAARDLRYEPNLRARGLRQQASYTVALVIPNLLNAYYTALADATSQLLADSGYNLLLSSSRDDPAIESSILRDMVGHDVAGLIWVPTDPCETLLEYLNSQPMPVVSLVRRTPGDRVDTVVFQDFEGSRTGTRHLLDLGHRRIGFVGGDEKHSSNSARWQGFRAAMQEAGVPIDDNLVRLGTLRSTWGYVATADLLGLATPPTALFAASNAVMPGLMMAVHQHGIEVPGEISLVCFDDVEWFQFSVPPITAVSVSYTKLAGTAVDLLLRRISDGEKAEKPPAFIEISYELVVRGSTSPPRAFAGPLAPSGHSEQVVASAASQPTDAAERSPSRSNGQGYG